MRAERSCGSLRIPRPALRRGSLPLESYALDHALLLWGFRSEAAARIGWYLQHYVRGADGVTPQQLTPGSNWTKASPGPPGSIDLKHWEDSVFFADSFADYGRWVELWIDTARAQEAAGEAITGTRRWQRRPKVVKEDDEEDDEDEDNE